MEFNKIIPISSCFAEQPSISLKWTSPVNVSWCYSSTYSLFLSLPIYSLILSSAVVHRFRDFFHVGSSNWYHMAAWSIYDYTGDFVPTLLSEELQTSQEARPKTRGEVSPLLWAADLVSHFCCWLLNTHEYSFPCGMRFEKLAVR